MIDGIEGATFQRTLVDLEDCQCVRCRAPVLLVADPDPDTIIRSAIKCSICDAEYDLIWGVPFLGAYDREDITGLIEIAANARADNLYPDGPTIRRLECLLRAYHEAPDRRAFVEGEPDEFVRAPWFSNRYDEWLHFTELTKDLSFSGLSVLDVGAGTGFDTHRLVVAGAQVTTLEYNPMLCRNGNKAVPEARWIGGLAHVLPFASGTFDAVCCNAALHHMRDVSAALEEMLRVLKPGGWLVTTGDSYRSRNSSIDTEFKVFNRHPAVLLGINESLPSFTAFETVLIRHRPSLDIRLLTGVLYRAPLRGLGRLYDIAGLHQWDFDKDRKMLGDASGNLGIRCRLLRSTGSAPTRQHEVAIAAGDYAVTLVDYPSAIQRLAALIPTDHVDREFPGTEQTKLELLNGWQSPDGSDARTAFKRARWYLRRPPSDDLLSFQVRRRPSAYPSCLNVLINGQHTSHCKMISDWLPIKIPLTSVAPGDIFVCELQLECEPAATAPSFDEELFQVRRRHFESAEPAEQARISIESEKRSFLGSATLLRKFRSAFRVSENSGSQ